MSLKDILQIIAKLSLILSILLMVVGGIFVLTGLGAITGIPLVLLGYFLFQSRRYLKLIIEDKEMTKNLFLYFKEVKNMLIIGFVVIVAIFVTMIIGYNYFSDLFNNIIF